MKKIALIIISIVIAFQLNAAQPFGPQDKLVGFAVGIGNTLPYSMRIPSFIFNYEMCVSPKLGIGYIGAGFHTGMVFNKDKWNYLGDEVGWNYMYIPMAATGAYHFDLVSNLDIYAGLGLGYYFGIASEIGDANLTKPTGLGGFYHTVFAGVRYYVKPNIGLMAELGDGAAILKVGVAYKF
jgi:hypothetical protein